jgi:hypothetical protein
VHNGTFYWKSVWQADGSLTAEGFLSAGGCITVSAHRFFNERGKNYSKFKENPHGYGEE